MISLLEANRPKLEFGSVFGCLCIDASVGLFKPPASNAQRMPANATRYFKKLNSRANLSLRGYRSLQYTAPSARHLAFVHIIVSVSC